jgi:hypothetical protein
MFSESFGPVSSEEWQPGKNKHTIRAKRLTKVFIYFVGLGFCFKCFSGFAKVISFVKVR